MQGTETAKLTDAEKIAKLQEENEDLRRQVSTLDSDNEDLEEELDDIRGRNDLGEALRLFADPSNWKNDRTWSPVMNYIEQDPVLLARRALDSQAA